MNAPNDPTATNNQMLNINRLMPLARGHAREAGAVDVLPHESAAA